jgi:hypothetical protein
MATNPRWYSKWVVSEREGGVLCPACDSRFPLDVAFDNAPRWCPSCKKRLIEWNFYSLVLIVDPETAPPLVKTIIEALSAMADFEAEEALKEVYQMFDRKAPS